MAFGFVTYHGKVLSAVDGGKLGQTMSYESALTVSPRGDIVEDGPLSGFSIERETHDADYVHLKKDGFYLSAQSDGPVDHDRRAPAEWERFYPIAADRISDFVHNYLDPTANSLRFKQRVEQLNGSGQPVKVHLGCGPVPRSGFLNIDIEMAAVTFAIKHSEDYFLFPFMAAPLPIADCTVDYIYHEDFIEHITQLEQFQFLAEALRVLKEGCFHRINTPNVISAMKRHSDFTQGMAGVYTGELQWGHISILSPRYLEEIAGLIGYRETIFTTKSCGVSPYAVADLRPSPDRDELVGNIFADLMK